MSWLTDMSANLAADVIVLSGVALAARAFINRRAARSLYIRVEPRLKDYSQCVRLTNLGQEPLMNVVVDQIPPASIARQATVQTLLGPVDLAPGETLRSRSIDISWLRIRSRSVVLIRYETPRNGKTKGAIIRLRSDAENPWKIERRGTKVRIRVFWGNRLFPVHRDTGPEDSPAPEETDATASDVSSAQPHQL